MKTTPVDDEQHCIRIDIDKLKSLIDKIENNLHECK